MPFGDIGHGEFGTYFIGYAASPAVTELMLENMFIGQPPGNTDRILDFSTAVTGGLFFAPSADFLDNLPPAPRALTAAVPVIVGGHHRGRRHALIRLSWYRFAERTVMNNLHRELAPISGAAWTSIEEEARRTFALHIAGRRVVDVAGPDGVTFAGLGTGRVTPIETPGGGVTAGLLAWRPVVQLRVPFTLDRVEVDSVEHGALDPDWQPVKDAAKQIAFAEDRAVFDGYPAAQITGLRPASSNQALTLPEEVHDYPDAVSGALTALRLAGVAARTPSCCPLTPTPRSARPQTTGTRSASTWPGSSTARSSGRRRSRARWWHLAGAATTSCAWARTCRSATSTTTRPTSACTSRRASRSPSTPRRRASRSTPGTCVTDPDDADRGVR